MLKNLCLYTLLFCMLTRSYGQSTQTGIEAGAMSASDALSNSFLNGLLLKRYISPADKSCNSPDAMNHAFAEGRVSMFFRNENKNATTVFGKKYQISLTHRSLISTAFTGDAYHMIFEGNQTYAGQTANMSGSAASMLSYQTIEYGIFNDFTLSGWDMSLYSGLGFVKGQQLTDLNISRGTIFTQADGEYIDASVAMQYRYYENKPSPFAFSGAGGMLHLKLTAEKDNNSFSVEANDLGFIRWMSPAKEVRFDSSFRFDGIPVDLFGDSISQSNLLGDTLQNLVNYHTRNYKGSKMLPAVISLKYSRKINEKISIRTSVIFYTGTKMKFPYTNVDVAYKISPSVSLSGICRYGFYNNLNIGAAVDLRFDKFGFRFDCMNLPSMILPKKTMMQGFLLNIHYNL